MNPNLSAQQVSFVLTQKRHKKRIILARFLIVLLWLFLWEISARLSLIDSFFFSCPSRILTTFLSMCQDFSIFWHTGITLLETLISFLFVIVITLLLSMLLWASKSSLELLEPFLVALNSLPKSALAPLLIVWLGTGMTTIIVAGISVAVFGSIITLYTAFLQVDNEKAKLIYTLGGHKMDVLLKVILPGSVPTILSTMKVNIGLTLVGVIIGEFLSARRGLGYLIIYSSQVFQLDRLILAILILCIIAMGLYQCLQGIERWYQKKN